LQGFFETREYTLRFDFSIAKIIDATKTNTKIVFTDEANNTIQSFNVPYHVLGFSLKDGSTTQVVDCFSNALVN